MYKRNLQKKFSSFATIPNLFYLCYHELSKRPYQGIKIRLQSISGQLNGIIKMLDEDRDPERVLMQFKAAKSALKSAENILLDETFRKSLAASIAGHWMPARAIVVRKPDWRC